MMTQLWMPGQRAEAGISWARTALAKVRRSPSEGREGRPGWPR